MAGYTFTQQSIGLKSWITEITTYHDMVVTWAKRENALGGKGVME